MVTSVNTNVGAMVALQNLNQTSSDLMTVQNEINTGLKVSSPKDNGGVFAIAQNMRADVGSLDAVNQSLDRASSMVDVAVSAGTAISDILTEMKEKAVAASDVSLDTSSRNALNEDFKALRDQITTIVTNAKFNGVDLIDGSLTHGVQALASADGKNHITVNAETMTLSAIGLSVGASIGTQTLASSQISLVDTALQTVNSQLARLGTGSKKLDIHKTFISQLSNSLQTGIGNLVDADLAQASAQLQSLQVKQQLGVQALSIANSAPQMLLSLFR
jgi:flagellin